MLYIVLMLYRELTDSRLGFFLLVVTDEYILVVSKLSTSVVVEMTIWFVIPIS